MKKKRCNRNKEQQQRVKNILLGQFGNFCWLCRCKFKLHDLTLHHIIEHQYSHHTVEEESCILCTHCHFDVVNQVAYQSKEYNDLMGQVEQYRSSRN
jgi:5-methylcytosine-specific restriction endonuclease McrA